MYMYAQKYNVQTLIYKNLGLCAKVQRTNSDIKILMYVQKYNVQTLIYKNLGLCAKVQRTNSDI